MILKIPERVMSISAMDQIITSLKDIFRFIHVCIDKYN